MGAATVVPEVLTSGLPLALGKRVANTALDIARTAADAPRIMGEVAEGRLDPSSPEAIRRSFDIATTFVGGGLVGAQRGALGAAGGKLPPRFPGLLQPRSVPAATFGRATSKDYQTTFINAHPELEGKVWVHHAVPRKVLTRYPGVIAEEEMHSLENLRGIPLDVNRDVHLSQIAKEWNAFYDKNQTASKKQLLDFATEIDGRFGHLFNPQR